MTTKRLIDADITDRADGLAVIWDDASGTHVYASAAGLAASKDWLSETADGRDYPGSPNAMDDEFDDGSIDVKWTKVNDPASSDAILENAIDGCITVGLAELGTDNFDNLVRFYQTPPTGTATMTFVARVMLGMTGHTGGEGGEFASVGVYLGNSADDEAIAACIQYNFTAAAYQAVIVLEAGGQNTTAGTIGGMTGEAVRGFLPGEWMYIKLVKSTTSAYTSANTYSAYIAKDPPSLTSLFGWQEVGSVSKTFTTACNEAGLYFRRPKSQSGSPKATAIVDFFRRVA